MPEDVIWEVLSVYIVHVVLKHLSAVSEERMFRESPGDISILFVVLHRQIQLFVELS